MRMWKSVLVVIGGLLPILYCARLLYYFLDVSGSVEEAQRDGLGPTLLGLGTIGLVFCIVVMVKIARMFARPHSPGSGGGGGRYESTPDGEGGFDAEAAVARYMAKRSAEAARTSPAAPPARESGGTARRQSFGRKTR